MRLRLDMTPTFFTEPPDAMKTHFDIEALSPADRLPHRMQVVRYWEERLLTRQALIKQARKANTPRSVLDRDAIEQAQRPCVAMDMVGIPLWKN
jgi:hypothetical protein